MKALNSLFTVISIYIIALFVIDVLLNYFLKDNEIYKKFIKLKRFNKER